MYLLYLDESGNENDASDRYFVLAGIALFERQTYFLSNALDQLQRRHFPGLQPVPFHSSEMLSGRGFWRNVPHDVRTQLLSEVAQEILASPPRGRVLYAAAIE